MRPPHESCEEFMNSLLLRKELIQQQHIWKHRRKGKDEVGGGKKGVREWRRGHSPV
jgi:hypothetical protein